MDEDRQRMSRRRLIAGIAAAATAASVPLLEADAAPKAMQQAVQYQTQPKNGQKCADCRFFIPAGDPAKSARCQIVDGDISASGWCKLFTPSD